MSTTPSTRLEVEVGVHGVSHPGPLEHRRTRGECWEGFVRSTEASLGRCVRRTSRRGRRDSPLRAVGERRSRPLLAPGADVV
jgi:hypothetical protein